MLNAELAKLDSRQPHAMARELLELDPELASLFGAWDTLKSTSRVNEVCSVLWLPIGPSS